MCEKEKNTGVVAFNRIFIKWMWEEGTDESGEWGNNGERTNCTNMGGC